jgi:hypothetical protein
MTHIISTLKDMHNDLQYIGHELKDMRSDINTLQGKVPIRTPGNVQQEDIDPASSLDPAAAPEEKIGDVVMADALQSGESPDTHSTGVHNLFQWPGIKKFYQSAGINDKNYLDELEKEQGVLRLYSFGNAGDQGVIAPPSSSGNAAATYPRPSDDTDSGSGWDHGKAFRYPPNHIGGLNTDSTLRLDKDTVMNLVESYIHNMWIIFPIIPLERLKQRVEVFMNQYSPDDSAPNDRPAVNTPPGSIHGHDSPYPGVPAKRSHPDSDREDTSRRGYAPPPKRNPDSSVNNAIVLLVLAIGKLCSYDKFLKTDQIWHRDTFENSPIDPTQAPISTPSPSIGRTASMSRSSSQDPARDKDQPLNVNVYPGLAYYAMASEILGSLTGGRDVLYVHAYALAALYMGQIGRVYAAYEWVSRAANIMVELRRKHEDTLLVQSSDESIGEDLTETLALTFWTLHQMEGDIRAELDHLPMSALASLVDGPNNTSVRFPRRLPSLVDQSTDQVLFKSSLQIKNLLFHFCAQLYIRKILNRIHATLYSEQSNRINPCDIVELRQQIEIWRPKPPYGPWWQDDDALANNILDARLRGKYYGAVYVVNRLWLQTMLHPLSHAEEQQPLVITDYNEVLKSGFRDEIQSGAEEDPLDQF